MVWFKVDDKLHSHPKALATSLGAIGLWTVAGSWSSDHHTDGFVPDYVLPSLCRGQSDLADELVAARLWKRARGGFQFHQWSQDGDGTVRNPTRVEVETRKARESSGGALGNHRRWHAAKGASDPKCMYCQRQQSSGTRSEPDQVPDGVPESPPSPPGPSRPGPSVGYVGGEPAEGRRARCPRHRHIPDDEPGPNCVDCRDVRLAGERAAVQSERDQRAAIRACTLCDADGWRWIDPRRRAYGTQTGPGARCDHTRQEVTT